MEIRCHSDMRRDRRKQERLNKVITDRFKKSLSKINLYYNDLVLLSDDELQEELAKGKSQNYKAAINLILNERNRPQPTEPHDI